MGRENERLPRSIPFRSLQTADEGNRLSRPGGETPRYPVYDSQLEYDNRGRQGSGRRFTGASSSSILWRSRERCTETKVRIPQFPATWHRIYVSLDALLRWWRHRFSSSASLPRRHVLPRRHQQRARRLARGG